MPSFLSTALLAIVCLLSLISMLFFIGCGNDDDDDDTGKDDDDLESDDDAVDDDTANDDDASDDDAGDDDDDQEEETNTWHFETVEEESEVTSNEFLALDQNGDPHMVYRSKSTRYLKYAVRRSGEWEITPLSTTCEYAVLELDGDGYAHIGLVVLTEGEAELRYSTNCSGIWESETIHTIVGKDSSIYPSIELDEDGNIHMATLESRMIGSGTYRNINYLTNLSGTWTSETVFFSDHDVGPPSIALDSQTRPHITYGAYQWPNAPSLHHLFMHTYFSQGTWVSEIIDDDAESIFHSINVGPENVLYTSYGSYRDYSFLFATWDPALGSWLRYRVDADSSSPWWIGSSMAVESDGTLHLVYGHTIDEFVRYFSDRTGQWELTSLAESTRVKYFVSMDVDSSGRPHIGYMNLSDRKIIYAYWK